LYRIPCGGFFLGYVPQAHKIACGKISFALRADGNNFLKRGFYKYVVFTASESGVSSQTAKYLIINQESLLRSHVFPLDFSGRF